MQRLFVSDLIGDDYTNWKGGDNVLISTLTGSGKTTFVFEKLLPFAAEHKKHIVYLCNRKSLNAQITRIVEESFKAKVKEELREYIHIRTYQHCEVVKDYPDIKKLDEDNKIVIFKVAVSYGCEITKYVNDVTEKDVLYYVFDEAHYFLADSCFNDRSDYWFEKIDIEQPKNSIKIFLTATPEPLYLFLSSKKSEVDCHLIFVLFSGYRNCIDFGQCISLQIPQMKKLVEGGAVNLMKASDFFTIRSFVLII